MNTALIELWQQGKLTALQTIRVIATLEAQCNLACAHCYWSHDIEGGPVADWGRALEKLVHMRVPIFFAGRILTPRAARFLHEYRRQFPAGEINIVDNGSTILTQPELIQHYETINISIDGWREDHDVQRGKVGSFDTAWNAILELKRQGKDPIISAAISPLTTGRWKRLEQHAAEHDVPISSTLVWDLPETARRGTAVFESDTELCRAFEMLILGVPKLVNVYSLKQVELLWPILSSLTWKKDAQVGDCLVAELGNGTQVVYRPASLSMVAEQSLEWTGHFYTPFTYGFKMRVDALDHDYFERVRTMNATERARWSPLLK